MDELKKGWFTELCPLWPGRALSMRVEVSVCDFSSPFQRVEVFRAEGFGIVLALDGKVQCAESDEFMYHEMLAHVPAFSHPSPRKALVIGGGDGGAARELLRHASIELLDVCEIDKSVVDVSRRHLPFTARAFDDSRVHLHFVDGSRFVKERRGFYDLVVVDAPDPIGPGEALFREAFLKDAKGALADGGVLAAQSESFLLHRETAERQCALFSKLFAHWGYCAFPVPSYPGGGIGFCAGSDSLPVSEPCREPDSAIAADLECYSGAYHRASFVLPAFWGRILNGTPEN